MDAETTAGLLSSLVVGINRRWSQGTYVGRTSEFTLPPATASSPPAASAEPPADGSCPFLQLPAEVRLQIYSFCEHQADKRANCFTFPRQRHEYSQSRIYTDLYRSPGRTTMNNPVYREMVTLLHVCRQVRSELLDVLFTNRVWVLEASFYSGSTAGLMPIPPSAKLPPVSWIKRLLVVTAMYVDILPQNLPGLDFLSRLTELEEVRFLVAPRRFSRKGHTLDSPIIPVRRFNDSVPRSAKISWGADPSVQVDLVRNIGTSICYAFA